MPALHNLALLTRAPEPGRSKTRLIPRLEAQGACAFASAALLDTLHLLREVPSCRRVLFYTPRTAGPDLHHLLEREDLAQSWELQPQPDAADLGGRLQAALEHMQTASSSSATATATFIGMDCLDLTPGLVQASMERVQESHRAAHMIPAHDGGYVLLSVPLACDSGRLFSEITWSTERTGEMQRLRLGEAGLVCEVGGALADVDEPEDLERLGKTRGDWGARFPRTLEYLETVMVD